MAYEYHTKVPFGLKIAQLSANAGSGGRFVQKSAGNVRNDLSGPISESPDPAAFERDLGEGGLVFDEIEGCGVDVQRIGPRFPASGAGVGLEERCPDQTAGHRTVRHRSGEYE